MNIKASKHQNMQPKDEKYNRPSQQWLHVCTNLKYVLGYAAFHYTHLQVVFPTPPFPPTNIQRSDRWSIIFWSDGSNGSKSSRLMLTSAGPVDVILTHSLSSAGWNHTTAQT
jgi:hypothetical protein